MLPSKPRDFMDAPLATVLAAIITASVALVGHLVNRVRKENKDDHAYVQGLLSLLHKSQTRIERKIERVDDRLTDHLEFHLSEGVLDNGRTVHQNGVEEARRVS